MPKIATDAHSLDTRGMLCPLPVLKIIRQLRQLDCGEMLQVKTDDPAAVIDIPHFCNEHQHSLISQREIPDGHEFVIMKEN